MFVSQFAVNSVKESHGRETEKEAQVRGSVFLVVCSCTWGHLRMALKFIC